LKATRTHRLKRRTVSGVERKRSWWLETFSSAEQLMAEFVKAHGRKAKDVMTRQVISVSPDTSLQEISLISSKSMT
jgi:CBS domain-containing protein